MSRPLCFYAFSFLSPSSVSSVDLRRAGRRPSNALRDFTRRCCAGSRRCGQNPHSIGRIAIRRPPPIWPTLGMSCEAEWSHDRRETCVRSRPSHTIPACRAPGIALAIAHGRARRRGRGSRLPSIASIALDSTYAPAQWRRGLWLIETGRDSGCTGRVRESQTLDPANPGGLDRSGSPRAATAAACARPPKRSSGSCPIIRAIDTRFLAGNRLSATRPDRRCGVCARAGRDRRAELAGSVERRAGAVSRRLRAEPEGGDRADPQRRVRRRDSRLSRS